jgi:hypothetical protein
MVQAESEDKITVDKRLFIDLVDAIIEGVKHGHTKREIIGQVDLIFDKQAQKAIERGMKEHKEGRTKRFSDVKKLINYLNK